MKKLSELLEKIHKKAKKESNISLGEIYSSFGRRAYGPFLFMVGLLILSPIGAIPGVGILAAIVSLLFSVQFFFLPTPWMPDRILNIEIASSKIEKMQKTSRPYIEKIEKYIKPRLTVITKEPFSYLTMSVVILVSISMAPVAPIPWGITLPALALMFIGIASITHDGILMAIGYVFSAASIYLIYFTLFS